MRIRKAAQSAGIIGNIVDNLNSTSTQDALSAQQGKILNESKINKNGDIINGNLIFSKNNRIIQESSDVFQANSESAFGSIEKWRVSEDGEKRRVVFGNGSNGAAVLEAQDMNGNIKGRFEVRQDGTLYNYITKKTLLENEQIEIPYTEFFSKLNFNVMDWKCYRQGNLIDIQRFVIEAVDFPDNYETSIGTMNSAYAPCGNCTIRIMASAGGGNAVNGVFMLNGATNNVAMYKPIDMTATDKRNVYVFNSSYLAKGGF